VSAYIRRHRLEDQSVRIDVVAVTFDAAGTPVVEHYQNAFDDPG
jgi:Holliday junction resolvase-like predicted endonuclease